MNTFVSCHYFRKQKSVQQIFPSANIMSTGLPIIDLGPLHSLPKFSDRKSGDKIEITADQQTIAKKIQDACRHHGFFYVSNHGIDATLVQNTMQSTRDLFNIPSIEKEKISSKKSALFRGYISTSDALHTCNSKKKNEVGVDQKESFTLGAEGEGQMRGANQWPSAEYLPTFQDTMQKYWNAQLDLCRVISRGLALS